jgi:phosphoserine aminotransferase
MAMWSMLGERPVDICYWESFGKGWFGDGTSQLKLDNVTEFKADYGKLPDLASTNPKHDILFTWNGTTSGVRVPDGDWIADDREGLTMCDATSAVFAMDMPWEKLDVTTYSWQKVLGGEGAHGVLVLSPRAVERLESYTPPWPMPKIFRMVKKGAVDTAIFEGSTINTPSMMCVEDCLDALAWADSIGGNDGLIQRSESNLQVIREFVAANDWIDFLAENEAETSCTSICLSVALEKAQIKTMTNLLEAEGVAYDIGSYRDAPPGLRIWGGATVEASDLKKLMPWLQWAYEEAQK